MKKASINEWLERGVENIYPSSNYFSKILKSKKKISIYLGIDATGSQLHLGHSTNFFILRKLQDLGHKIIILVGDFTAMIGDPTDKMATRQPLTRKEVLKNCQTYQEQAEKILQFSGKNPVKIAFNSKWLSKLVFSDLVEIASHLTVQQLLSRDMFQKRLQEKKQIALHEFLYPLMQGYDSVAMEIDAEMGGNDQTFNMLVGRDLTKRILNKEKIVIATRLLENPKTGKKMMSKSEGDFIALNDSPQEMFGKVMSLPDENILPCFNLCTDLPTDEIRKIENDLKKGANPRDIKIKLANEIVAIYHSIEYAKNAEAEFNRIFKDKEIPFDIPVFKIKSGKCVGIIELLKITDLCESKGEARRILLQGGVRIDKSKITDVNGKICVHNGMIIQAGKRRFVKINLL